MEKDKLTYEAAYKELESIMNALQDNKVNVDELTEKVSRATELIKFCSEKLRVTETKISDVIKQLGM